MKTERGSKAPVSGGFLLLLLLGVIAWHFPLFLSPKTQLPDVKAQVVQPETRHIVLQPARPDFSTGSTSLKDPTVFLLPSSIGFSGYHAFPSPNLQSMGASLSAPRLSHGFESSLKYDPSSRDLLAAMETSPGISHFTEEVAVGTPGKTPDPGTGWALSEGLMSRMRKPHPSFPKTNFGRDLGPVQIRLAVSSQGMVGFVILEKGSGFDAADDRVLRFARDLVFTPLDGGENAWQWGILRVDWRTDRFMQAAGE